MHKFLIAILLTTISLGSCAPVPASPTQSTATATSTFLPTSTSSPTQTSIPTATPYPPLQTEGPYLLFTYDNQNSPIKNFTLMDADGSGQKQFQLPDDGYIHRLNRSVSPDGQWLAYFTGSTTEPYDITLNLFNLDHGTTQLISSLIAPNFPENLEPVMENMLFSEGDDCSQSIECRMTLLRRSFINGIYSLDWSPNGRFLAFAAQIDGPSSDLYIYSIQDNTVHRLTNDLQNIETIEWAPNDHKIMYSNSIPGSLYAGRTVHIADPANLNVQTPQKLTNAGDLWGAYGWMSENLYLFYEPNDTDPPVSHINILNTDTAQSKEIWPYTADFFVVNKETTSIVLMHKNHPSQGTTVPEGIYMVYPDGTYLKISDIGIWFVLVAGQSPYPFFAQDYNGQIYSLDNSSAIMALPWDIDKIPLISPNEKFLLFRERNSLALYTDSYQPIKSWQMEDDIYNSTWRPDSLGLFIFTNKNAYYLPIPDGEPRPLLEACSSDPCEIPRFVWLP